MRRFSDFRGGVDRKNVSLVPRLLCHLVLLDLIELTRYHFHVLVGLIEQRIEKVHLSVHDASCSLLLHYVSLHCVTIAHLEGRSLFINASEVVTYNLW